MSDTDTPCEQDLFERELILDDLKRTLQFAATDIQQFRSRTTDLASHQRKFNKVQCKIEKTLIKLKSFNKEEQIKVRNDFNDLYYAIITHLNKIKQDEEHRRMSRSTIVPPVPSYGNKNLPTLPLPSFNGDPTDWPSYFDLFRSLVHLNNAYTDAEKFRYLLLTVHNEPHNLIKSIPITDDNYSVALEILITRYENKRVIASKHLDRILDIAVCSEKSIQTIRNLLNTYHENIKALESMHFPTKQWSFILLGILLRKIPLSTHKCFERSLNNSSDIPDVSTLISFLEREISAHEAVSLSSRFTTESAGDHALRRQGTAAAAASHSIKRPIRTCISNVDTANSHNNTRSYINNNVRSKVICICCNESHSLTKCSHFLNLNPQERYSLIKNNNICYNCLHTGHSVSNCKSNFVCRTCHARHHTLIHFYTPESNNNKIAVNNAVSLPPPVTSTDLSTANDNTPIHNYHVTKSIETCKNTVLLSTALVDVYIGISKLSTVRCIIDTGSQASFVTESCAQRLGLIRKQINVPVYGIGDTEPVRPRGVVSCCIRPRNQHQPSIPVNLLVLSKLMSLMPSVPLPNKGWSHIENLNLADPWYHTPQPVDMLLGADILSHILLSNVVTGPPGSPIAMNSIFGYLLLGKLDIAPEPTSLQVCFSSFDNDNLQRFWELESLPEKRSYAPDEELCESFYQKTHSRDETGRYVVALPFKPEAPPLGESRQVAMARFRKLEYRLERNPKLKEDYHACLQEYVDLNHMEKVDSNSAVTGASYYIPHHCVVKESSETSRTRVVFDAGCKTSSGNSLNDILLTGPKLHLDIVDILLKFRIHAVAFTADIKQMYRNILVRKQDRDFQRILWRQSPEEPIQEYRLRTVTFGVNASPYLALRTIKQLALDESHFELAAPVLLNDVFVDDVISGGPNIESAVMLQRELISICQTAGFELRKWHSNSHEILATVLPLDSHGERQDIVPFAHMENDKQIKVLGLQWNPDIDHFSFQVKVGNTTCTKRAILSEIAKIYDPLGFLSPVTLHAKLLIQLLWMSNVGWDDQTPVDIINSWKVYTDELPLLSNVLFPRHIFPDYRSVQIHGFCDASERAYAASVYIRLTDREGCVRTYLAIAKTRVAPLRAKLTVPRLELVAAVMLSNLIEKVLQVYGPKFKFEQVFAWSDASIVLAWLRSPPREWKTFVSNRVSEILTRVPANCWRHVPSADNPADAASRGMLPAAFVQHKVWFNGPHWLCCNEDSWPVLRSSYHTDEERRTNVQCNITTTPEPDLDIFTRFSSLGKLVRVTSLIFRFFHKCKKASLPYPKHITVSEYNFSLYRLIQLVQQSVFNEDIKRLESNKLPSNQLCRLTPFLDKDKILRVGGRIDKSLLPYESKHQIILPKNNKLTHLIIDDAHITHLHAGPQSTQHILLLRYWILSCRDIVRQRIHRCVPCFRARPTRIQPRMAPLPGTRLQPSRPFVKTAVDYAGPFYVRANNVRNAKITKCYVSVFVCMSVKAIHLEIVSELSTESFLAALRRFTSRRGLCTDIYSDCGRNFVGCNNYLKELYTFLRSDSMRSDLNKLTLQQGITWHFQPPYASHFGGLFEAGVKSFKHHLHRVVGTRTQTYDEMHTLLCQIEAVLNSRPLCAPSAYASDPLPLTPSHFLIGEPLTSLPDISLLDENPNRLTRWRWVQQSLQHFWRRWSKEYLHELQQSQKWHKSQGSRIRVGDVVVVIDDNLPPLQWRLARVEMLHPGSDNVTRVVTLRRGTTLFKRPVVKVCPLPSE